MTTALLRFTGVSESDDDEEAKAHVWHVLFQTWDHTMTEQPSKVGVSWLCLFARFTLVKQIAKMIREGVPNAVRSVVGSSPCCTFGLTLKQQLWQKLLGTAAAKAAIKLNYKREVEKIQKLCNVSLLPAICLFSRL